MNLSAVVEAGDHAGAIERYYTERFQHAGERGRRRASAAIVLVAHERARSERA